MPACAFRPHSCASLQPQLCLAACPSCLCYPFHAVNGSPNCCPPETLYGCCTVAREEWKHCSTATMCWPWLTDQMASCWHLLLWMARSTCGTLKRLSSWYVTPSSDSRYTRHHTYYQTLQSHAGVVALDSVWTCSLIVAVSVQAIAKRYSMHHHILSLLGIVLSSDPRCCILPCIGFPVQCCCPPSA